MLSKVVENTYHENNKVPTCAQGIERAIDLLFCGGYKLYH